MLKELIIFAGGAAVGTTGGCIFFKKHYEKIAREEIQSVKDALRRHIEELTTTSLEDPSIGAEEEKEEPKKEEPVITNHNSLADGKPDPYATDYTKYYKEVGAEAMDPADSEYPREDDEELEQIKQEVLNDELRSKRTHPPEIIKADDVGETFEVSDLYYYTDDDVLANDAEEMIGKTDGGELYLVGDCLTKFGFKDDDSQKTIFVRNYELGIDYCVTKIWGAYIELCT